MIEVQESYSRDGVHAVVTGGKTQVVIRPDAGRWIKGSYTDSPRWPSHETPATWLPEGYMVFYGRGRSTRVGSYQRAVELAVYHARRA